MMSRDNVTPGKWRLHPQMVQMIQSVFGRAEVDLFVSEDNYHCSIYLRDSGMLWPMIGPTPACTPSLRSPCYARLCPQVVSLLGANLFARAAG